MDTGTKKKKSKSKNLLPVLVYPCSHTSLGALPQTHLLYTPTPQIYVFSVYIWIQNSPTPFIIFYKTV